MIFIQKLLFLVFLMACSSKESSKSVPDKAFVGEEYALDLVSDIKPRWHQTLERFSHKNTSFNTTTHMFFDVSPELDIKTNKSRAVIVTPAQSQNLNGFDMGSGRPFLKDKYCSRYDRWKKYSKLLSKPNFSIGFIPRYLDEINRPQKVIVFGANDYISERFKTHFFDIRILGGFIERICPKRACYTSEDWISRLALIAVTDYEKQWQKVKTLDDLKDKVNWQYTQAFLRNGEGDNIISKERYAAYQLGAFIPANKALSYIKKKGRRFSLSQMKALKKTCYGLYDMAWNILDFKGINDLDVKTIQDLRKKRLLKSEYEQGGKKILPPLHKRFISFYKKHKDQYNTCLNYVNYSNISHDHKRHWKLTYITAFMRLYDLGYTYRCRSRAWMTNLYLSNGKRVYNLDKEFQDCSERDLHLAIKQAPAKLASLIRAQKGSYRYIEHDHALHEKIHSFVAINNKKMQCENSLKLSTFPKDVKWEY